MRSPAILVALVPCVVGCASGGLDRTTVPGHVDTSATIDTVPVRGFEVAVEVADGSSVEGELLAVDQEAIWVLTERGPLPLLRSNVREVLVQLREHSGTELGGWTAAGTFSTLSHGFWLIFSAPIWLLAGIPVSVDEILASRETAQSGSFELLYQFARFPQGPTPSMRRRASVSPGTVVTPLPGGPVEAPPMLPSVPPPPPPDEAPPPPPPPAELDGGPEGPLVPDGYGPDALTAPRPGGE